MSHPIISKQGALKEIKKLAEEHHLTLPEISAVLNPTKISKPSTETLMKLFAYLGGIFIFSGITIYIGTFWASMNGATKILLTFGTGAILYIIALLLPVYHKNNENMLSPLFLTSTFFQTIGLFVIFTEFKVAMNVNAASALIFGTMFIQQFITYQKVKRASLIFTSIFFWCAFFATFLDLLHISDHTIHIWVGLSVLGIAYRLDKKQYKSLANFWYFIGSILFLNGLFDALKNSWLEIGFVAISGLLLYFSTLIKNRILLFVSTLSALSYIGYFTSKHFMHSAAWPILLVLLGLICFGVGVMVLKISKKYL